MIENINFDEIVEKVQLKYPEFTDADIIEVCEAYVSTFPKKTKLESILKSLNKYITKEFWLDENTVETETEDSKHGLDTIPKSFFSSWAKVTSDFLIKIVDLQKALWSTILFEWADMQINPTDKIALIGRNWTGKSTLLKMMIWVEDPDEWFIYKTKDLKIWYLSQDLFWDSQDNTLEQEMQSVFPDITANMRKLNQINEQLSQMSDWEKILDLIHQKEELEKKLANDDWFKKFALQTDILKYFWFSKEQLSLKISNLSWWEQTKVQIAKFLLLDVDLLILDEPTNHLDIDGIMFLEKFCTLWQKWLICISHDKKFIDNVFRIIVEIYDKKLHTYFWDYNKYLEQKQKNYELQLKNFTTQQKELEKQQEFIDRFRYKASKAAQVQSRIKMLDKVEKLEAPTDESNVKDIELQLDIRLPNMILRLLDLQVWYNECLVKLKKNVEVTKDMKIWIIWKNWVWKTTLLKTILWELNPLVGESYINDKIKIWSYSQTAAELDMESSVIDELVGNWLSQKDARWILWWLLITWDKVLQKIWTLSGGERAKVALTKMLLQKPHLIIMDEPTNHLDLFSKEAIKNMLAQFQWVSIVVSHDRDLLESISNHLWVIKDKELEVYNSLERGFQRIIGG